MAFAVDTFGLGRLVNLAPAPELRVGFSVGLLCVLAFGSGFGVLPGVCVLVIGSRFSCVGSCVCVWFESLLLRSCALRPSPQLPSPPFRVRVC